MEDVYLKFPTEEDKDKWIDFIKEYRLDDPNSKPLGCTENLNYDFWLRDIIDEHNGINLQNGRVPSSIYFLMNDDRIVGYVSIRHNIDNEFLSRIGGHIGYGVRPSERRKGYATKLLSLALEKCDELGLGNVLVTCKEDNIGSAKTIENNYGVLEETVFIPEENCNFKKYWINVKEALDKKDEIRRR